MRDMARGSNSVSFDAVEGLIELSGVLVLW